MSKQLTDEPTEPAQGTSFFDDPKDLEQLAREQGVQPLNFNELMATPTLWPEEESVDDFVATLRQWRKEGKADKGL